MSERYNMSAITIEDTLGRLSNYIVSNNQAITGISLSSSPSYMFKEDMLLKIIENLGINFNFMVFEMLFKRDFEALNKHFISYVVDNVFLSQTDISFYKALLNTVDKSDLKYIGFYSKFCEYYGIEL